MNIDWNLLWNIHKVRYALKQHRKQNYILNFISNFVIIIWHHWVDIPDTYIGIQKSGYVHASIANISTSGLSSLGVPWHTWHNQILADQLTLFQPGAGTHYAHLITTGTPGIQTFRRPFDLDYSSCPCHNLQAHNII